nr:hypothetical protein MTCCP1_00018 [uncultured bacterium]
MHPTQRRWLFLNDYRRFDGNILWNHYNILPFRRGIKPAFRRMIAFAIASWSTGQPNVHHANPIVRMAGAAYHRKAFRCPLCGFFRRPP